MLRRHSPLFAIFLAAASALAYWEWSTPVDRTPGRRLTAIALSPSGAWIATGNAAGWISVWQPADPDHTTQEFLVEGATPRALAFSGDERLLAVAHSRGLALHSVTALELLRTLREGTGYHSVVSPPQAGTAGDGTWLAVSDAGSVERTDAGPCCQTTGSAAYTPDQAYLVTSGSWPALWNPDGTLAARLTAEGQYSDFGPIAFDTRRGWLLMGSRDGRVYAWDLATRELRAHSPQPAGAVESIAVVRGSPWIAYAKTGAPVHLWNPDTAEQRTLAALPSANIVAGKEPYTILVGNFAGSVQTWDTDSGELLQQRTLR